MQTICVWADGTWCYPEDLWEFDWKSDDIERWTLPEEFTEEQIEAEIHMRFQP